jgi:hypothetical protein
MYANVLVLYEMNVEFIVYFMPQKPTAQYVLCTAVKTNVIHTLISLFHVILYDVSGIIFLSDVT